MTCSKDINKFSLDCNLDVRSSNVYVISHLQLNLICMYSMDGNLAHFRHNHETFISQYFVHEIAMMIKREKLVINTSAQDGTSAAVGRIA